MLRPALVLMLMLVVFGTLGHADDAALAPLVAPVAPALDGAGLEAWFFDFLSKLLDLFASFIGQILREIFSGIGGLISGTTTTAAPVIGA